VYAYILMECANCGRFLTGDSTQGFLRVKNGKWPYAQRAEMAA
jgi:phage FluMu protein Com